MRYLHLLFASFIFLLMQMVLAPKIAIGQIAPDFSLLLVAYLAINRGAIPGSVAGFFVGFVQDLLNPELLGLNALTKSVVGYAMGIVGSKGEPGVVPFLAALLAVSAVAHDFLYLLVYTDLNIGRFLVMFFTIAVPSALYTAIVGVVVHKIALYSEAKVVKSFGKARP